MQKVIIPIINYKFLQFSIATIVLKKSHPMTYQGKLILIYLYLTLYLREDRLEFDVGEKKNKMYMTSWIENLVLVKLPAIIAALQSLLLNKSVNRRCHVNIEKVRTF